MWKFLVNFATLLVGVGLVILGLSTGDFTWVMLGTLWLIFDAGLIVTTWVLNRHQRSFR